MVPCHSCYIYGIWRSEEMGRRFKVIIRDINSRHKGRGSFRGRDVLTMQYGCTETLL